MKSFITSMKLLGKYNLETSTTFSETAGSISKKIAVRFLWKALLMFFIMGTRISVPSIPPSNAILGSKWISGWRESIADVSMYGGFETKIS